ncbi:DNA invertase Pin-like site-specific DNA recombinase [Streptosporangium album]|uniref:DNA invertase Pin-like site-specific DNA recombinase n=1 Tax=Streptosporangium album TaxID=47479 RepID=A0A7W7W809_9ACTN|nr:DNA invertase Pin-like site-specific DNA recombinase [Streptosporangium album]
MTAFGCRRIFTDSTSGRNAQRPELEACHAFLAVGDTLVVPSLDRYGRSLADLITMVADLRRREIGFTSLQERIDTTTPGGRLIFHVFAALAEFIRELIVIGTNEGLAAARARGRHGGRPKVFDDDMIAYARTLRERGVAVPDIARKLVIPTGKNKGRHPSVASVYRVLADAGDVVPTAR